MTNFDKSYWDKNYSDPMSMDGIGNAREHARYLKSYFAIEHVDVESIIDLGFGYGHLFREMLKTFLPHRALGLEPSEYIFKKAKPDKLRPVESTQLALLNEDLLSWCQRKFTGKPFDLALCTSVLQYIPTKDLKVIIPVIAKRVKFLYLTAPTDVELGRQVSELDFKDEYAIHRTRKQYQRLLQAHFTFISSRILESRHFFDEESTPFTDLLYRF
jgi:hypothetical protein